MNENHRAVLKAAVEWSRISTRDATAQDLATLTNLSRQRVYYVANWLELHGYLEPREFNQIAAIRPTALGIAYVQHGEAVL